MIYLYKTINISLINSYRAIESGIANISNIDTVSNKHTTPIKLLINSILESFSSFCNIIIH